jgi:hypothetical protein
LQEEVSYTCLPVSRNCLSLFHNGDVTGYDLAGRDFLFRPPANDLVRIEASTKESPDHKGLGTYDGFHGDACFELFDDVPSLFLLIPTNKRVEHEYGNLSLCIRRKER